MEGFKKWCEREKDSIEYVKYELSMNIPKINKVEIDNKIACN